MEDRNLSKKHYQDSLVNLTKSCELVKRLLWRKGTDLDQISY